ncbi:MAG: hypothetical protein P4L31_00615 [Candidatus Babeliales bacterium]|nr:hypothetical protein [Candidatus Babeliales bacterium]
MANCILKNGVPILNCANWVMEYFFNNFCSIVEQKLLKNNKIMCEFLEQLDQEVQGGGLITIELNDYFNGDANKLPLTLFYDLTIKTIEKIKHQNNFGEFQVGLFNRLDEFSNKIISKEPMEGN